MSNNFLFFKQLCQMVFDIFSSSQMQIFRSVLKTKGRSLNFLRGPWGMLLFTYLLSRSAYEKIESIQLPCYFFDLENF